MTGVEEKVVTHDFFRGMEPPHLRILSECASEIAFEADTYLFHEGEPSDSLYLIEKGLVAIEAHELGNGTVAIQTAKAGDVLGWASLFPPFVWHFQARTLTSAAIIKFSGAHLLTSAEEDHDFGYELMKRLARIANFRLQAACSRLLEDEALLHHFRSGGLGVTADRAAELNEQLRAAIRAHSFVDGMKAEDLEFIVSCASTRVFKTGQDVFREHQEANTFHLVNTGRVLLRAFTPNDGVATVDTVEEREALGWSWLFPPYKWQFSAEAAAPTELICFDAVRLRQRIEEDHEFGYQFMRRVSRVMLQRLQATRRRLIELYCGG